MPDASKSMAQTSLCAYISDDDLCFPAGKHIPRGLIDP
jgi:hypothetical protein